MGKTIYLNEDQFQAIIKRSLNENLYFEDGDDDDDDDLDSDKAITRYDISVIPEHDDIDDTSWGKFRTILPLLKDSNDSSVNSFSLTRSQIAYALWPGLDKDSARSKLSQKIEGNKPWRESELNKIANIIGL